MWIAVLFANWIVKRNSQMPIFLFLSFSSLYIFSHAQNRYDHHPRVPLNPTRRPSCSLSPDRLQLPLHIHLYRHLPGLLPSRHATGYCRHISRFLFLLDHPSHLLCCPHDNRWGVCELLLFRKRGEESNIEELEKSTNDELWKRVFWSIVY